MASKERKAYIAAKGLAQFGQALSPEGSFGDKMGQQAEQMAESNIARIAQEEYDKEQEKQNKVFGLDMGEAGSWVKKGLSVASNIALPVAGPAIVDVADDSLSGRQIDVKNLAVDAAINAAAPAVFDKAGSMLADTKLGTNVNEFLANHPTIARNAGLQGGTADITVDGISRATGQSVKAATELSSPAAQLFSRAGQAGVNQLAQAASPRKSSAKLDTTGLNYETARDLQANIQRAEALDRDYQMQSERFNLEKDEFALRKKQMELNQRRLDQDYQSKLAELAQPKPMGSAFEQVVDVPLPDGSPGQVTKRIQLMQDQRTGQVFPLEVYSSDVTAAPIDRKYLQNQGDVYEQTADGLKKVVEAKPDPTKSVDPLAQKSTIVNGKTYRYSEDVANKYSAILNNASSEQLSDPTFAERALVESGAQLDTENSATPSQALANYEGMQEVAMQSLAAQGLFTNAADPVTGQPTNKLVPTKEGEAINKALPYIAREMTEFQDMFRQYTGQNIIPAVSLEPAIGIPGRYITISSPSGHSVVSGYEIDGNIYNVLLETPEEYTLFAEIVKNGDLEQAVANGEIQKIVSSQQAPAPAPSPATNPAATTAPTSTALPPVQPGAYSPLTSELYTAP